HAHLSLHDALPISPPALAPGGSRARRGKPRDTYQAHKPTSRRRGQPALRPPRSTKLARPSYTGMAIRTARSNSSLPSRLCVEQVTSKQTECQACPARHPRLPLSVDRVQIDDLVFAGQQVRGERALRRPEPDDARASLLVRGVLQVRRPASSHAVQDLPVGELPQASGGAPVGAQLRGGPRRQV